MIGLSAHLRSHGGGYRTSPRSGGNTRHLAPSAAGMPPTRDDTQHQFRLHRSTAPPHTAALENRIRSLIDRSAAGCVGHTTRTPTHSLDIHPSCPPSRLLVTLASTWAPMGASPPAGAVGCWRLPDGNLAAPIVARLLHRGRVVCSSRLDRPHQTDLTRLHANELQTPAFGPPSAPLWDHHRDAHPPSGRCSDAGHTQMLLRVRMARR